MKPTFYQIDVTDEVKLEEIFKNHKTDGVIHFSGLKAVGESVDNLVEYNNNLISTRAISKLCLKYNLLFSRGYFYSYNSKIV